VRLRVADLHDWIIFTMLGERTFDFCDGFFERRRLPLG
jgi:hypothetical protein